MDNRDIPDTIICVALGILLLALAALLVISIIQERKSDTESKIAERFIRIKRCGEEFYIILDLQTGCKYIEELQPRGCALSPLYDENGAVEKIDADLLEDYRYTVGYNPRYI